MLRSLTCGHQQWLILRVLDYARPLGYADPDTEPSKAWQASIAGLSEILNQAVEILAETPPKASEDLGRVDALLEEFGKCESHKHLMRSVSFPMFSGLFRHFRQSYLDLLDEGGFSVSDYRKWFLFVTHCFNRLEAIFNTEWQTAGQEATKPASDLPCPDKSSQALTQGDGGRELLLICSACRKVKVGGKAWEQIDAYHEKHAATTLSHGICPECLRRLYPDYLDDEDS